MGTVSGAGERAAPTSEEQGHGRSGRVPRSHPLIPGDLDSDSALGLPGAALRQGGTIHLLLGVVQLHVVVAQGASDRFEVGAQGGCGGLAKGVRLNLSGDVVDIVPKLPEAGGVGYWEQKGFDAILGE